MCLPAAEHLQSLVCVDLRESAQGMAEQDDQLIHKLDRVQGRVRSFFEIYTWTIKDFLSHVWQHMILLLMLAGAFLALRVYVVSAVIQAIRRIGNDAGPWSGSISVPIVGDIPFSVFAIIVWLLLSLTAAVGYLFQKTVFFITGRYMRVLIRRLANAYGQLPNLYRRLTLKPPERRRYLPDGMRHARMMTIFFRITLFSSFEMASALVCYCILVWLNPTVTSIFSALIVFALPIFYRLSLYGFMKKQAMPVVFSALNDELRTLDGDLQADRPLARQERNNTVDKIVDGEVAERALHTFQEQRLIVFRSDFVAGILTASIIALSIFMYILNSQEVSNVGDQFTLFFSVLLVMGYSLARSLKSIVSANRFFESLMFGFRALGPGGTKSPSGDANPGVAMTYQRRKNGEVDVPERSNIYLYFPAAKRRFDWVTLINRLTPVRQQTSQEDGTLVLVGADETNEGTPDLPQGALPFLSDGVLKSLDEASRTVFLEKLFGRSPRVIVLGDPLAQPPEHEEDWLYIWGEPDKVAGDTLPGDPKKSFPDADRLRQTLGKAAAAKPVAEDYELDEELM